MGDDEASAPAASNVREHPPFSPPPTSPPGGGQFSLQREFSDECLCRRLASAHALVRTCCGCAAVGVWAAVCVALLRRNVCVKCRCLLLRR